MAHNMVGTLVDDNGLNIDPTATALVAAGVGTTVIKNGPGRLARVMATGATSTGALTIYDSVGAASGTVLAVIPSGATAGTIYNLGIPAAVGITAVGASGSAAVTVAYS